MNGFAFDVENRAPGFGFIFCKIVFCKEFKLSKRESEVLALIYLGISVNEISAILCRALSTIYKHLENAKNKLNCDNLVAVGIKLACIIK